MFYCFACSKGRLRDDLRDAICSPCRRSGAQTADLHAEGVAYFDRVVQRMPRARPVTDFQGHAIRWDIDALDEDVYGGDHYFISHVMPSSSCKSRQSRLLSGGIAGSFADSATTLAAAAALLWHFVTSCILL